MDINDLEYPYHPFFKYFFRFFEAPNVKELIGYAQQDISIINLQTTKYRISELTEFMDAYTSNYVTNGTSEMLKKLYCLNLTHLQELEYKAQQKNFFTYHLTFLCSQTQRKCSQNVQF